MASSFLHPVSVSRTLTQVLDQLLVTDNLRYYTELDIVHVNVDFARVDDSVASDHEQLLSCFYLYDNEY
ncbi:MAG: hypothetical protein ACR2P1_17340 [Pseudomonadales bacterium]